LELPIRYDKTSKLDCVPPVLEMDYSVILNKPFLLDTVDWPNTATRHSLLLSYELPGDVLANALAEIPFIASVYYRAKISMVFQVSGTPMHQGILLASAQPFNNLGGSIDRINSYLSAPHVFLHANESTSVALEIPFYVNSKLAPIDFTDSTVVPSNIGANFCSVELMVFNPLGVPSSGSTTVSVSAHVVFRELEFYVPHIDPEWVPFPGFLAEGFIGNFYEGVKATISKSLDSFASGVNALAGDLLDKTKGLVKDGVSAVREGVRAYTGLHNPEIPALDGRCAVQTRQNFNLVDTPNFFEKLDPYANFTKVFDDYYFDTDVDEMLVSEIISKPQFIGSFKVTSADPSGTILWSRPISPAQENRVRTYTDAVGTQSTTVSSNLLQTLSKLSRFWKGSINIHLQSSMTNFHFCKLIVARDYSPDVKMLTSYPAFESVANLMTETLEFSAGGQVHTVKMPFCSPLSVLPCSADLQFNALQHGMYYVYLYQPLVINGTVPTTIEFNVYVSAGDDFDFFGYSVDPLRMYKPTSDPVLALEDVEASSKWEAESEVQAPVPVNSQEAVDLSPHQEMKDEPYHMRPIKHVRDYIRRFYNVASQRVLSTTLTSENGCFSVPVASLLGLNQRGDTEFEYHSTLAIIKGLFLGYKGGLKAKLLVNGSPKVQVWYVPPSYTIDNAAPAGETQWIRNNAIPSSASTAFLPIQEMFQAPNFVPPSTAIQLGVAYASQTVSVEAPNYVNSNSALVLSNGAGFSEPIAMSVCELEFEIPYMSPFKFVGNSDLFVNITSTNAINALNDLGSLVIKATQPALFEVGQSTVKTGITYQLYIAATDETRLGFQINAPTIGYGSRNIPTIGETFLISQSSPINNYPPQALVVPTTGLYNKNLTPLYYTRSV